MGGILEYEDGSKSATEFFRRQEMEDVVRLCYAKCLANEVLALFILDVLVSPVMYKLILL